MARHIITIPINKSANRSLIKIGQAGVGFNDMWVDTVSDLLYIGAECNIGIAWDGNNIPSNKNIIITKKCSLL